MKKARNPILNIIEKQIDHGRSSFWFDIFYQKIYSALPEKQEQEAFIGPLKGW